MRLLCAAAISCYVRVGAFTSTSAICESHQTHANPVASPALPFCPQDYFQARDPGRNLTSQVWLPQDPAHLLASHHNYNELPATAAVASSFDLIGILPRNGDMDGGFGGHPSYFFDAGGDFLNAGVGLFGSSPGTLDVSERASEQSV